MFLKVSPKAGMWGFGPLWFTFADPAPQDVSLDELDDDTKNAIQLAIKTGKLLEVDEDGNAIKRQESPSVQSVCPVVTDNTQEHVKVSPLMLQKLKDLLKSGVTTVKREIPFLNGIDMLSTAMQLEKEGKNRKTVISLLEKAIEKTGNLHMYDDLIKEEDVETVVFDLNDVLLETQDRVVELNDMSPESLQSKLDEL